MKSKLFLGILGASLILTGLAGCSEPTNSSSTPSTEPPSSTPSTESQYATTIVDTTNGKLTKESSSDGNIVLAVAPETGYKLVDVIIDGEAKGSAFVNDNLKNNKLTLALAKDANHTVQGLFALSDLPSFSFGNGTEANPYKVLTFEDLQKTAFTYTKDDVFYFEQGADIDFNLTDEDYKPTFFSGVYNGNNKKITLKKDPLSNAQCVSLFVAIRDITVENLITVSSETCVLSVVEDMWSYDEIEDCNRNITLKNIDCTVEGNKAIKINESNIGFLVLGHINNNTPNQNTLDLSIEDCKVTANISNSATCTSAFVGGFYPVNFLDYNLSIKNSSYTGTMVGKGQAGLIFGNSFGIDTYLRKDTNTLNDEHVDYFKKHVALENVSLNGEISAFDNTGRAVLGTDGSKVLANLSKEYNDKINVQGNGFTKATNALAGSTLTIKHNNGGFYISGDGYKSDVDYSIDFNIAQFFNGQRNAALNGRDISIPLTNSTEGQEFTSSGIKNNADCGLFTKTEAKEKLPEIFTEDVLKGLDYKYTYTSEFKIALYIHNNLMYFVLDDTGYEGASTYNEEGNHVGKISNISVYAYSSTGTMTGFKVL